MYPKRFTLRNDASPGFEGQYGIRLRPEARQQSLGTGKKAYFKASRGVVVRIGLLTALMSFKNLGLLSHTTSKAGTKCGPDLLAGRWEGLSLTAAR
jgi:hypothetical protein